MCTDACAQCCKTSNVSSAVHPDMSWSPHEVCQLHLRTVWPPLPSHKVLTSCRAALSMAPSGLPRLGSAHRGSTPRYCRHWRATKSPVQCHFRPFVDRRGTTTCKQQHSQCQPHRCAHRRVALEVPVQEGGVAGLHRCAMPEETAPERRTAALAAAFAPPLCCCFGPRCARLQSPK